MFGVKINTLVIESGPTMLPHWLDEASTLGGGFVGQYLPLYRTNVLSLHSRKVLHGSEYLGISLATLSSTIK